MQRYWACRAAVGGERACKLGDLAKFKSRQSESRLNIQPDDYHASPQTMSCNHSTAVADLGFEKWFLDSCGKACVKN